MTDLHNRLSSAPQEDAPESVHPGAAFRAQLEGDATEEELVVQIRATIMRCPQRGELTNAALYDEVYAALVGDGPMERATLRRYLELYSIALRAELRDVAGRSRWNRATFPEPAPLTSIHMAQIWPAHVQRRLNEFDTSLADDTAAAEVYALWDFASCTESEIQLVLGLSPAEVSTYLDDAKLSVWRGDEQPE